MDSNSILDRLKYVGNYQLEKTLGEGTFGKVKLGTHLLTGEKVAVKILDKEKLVDAQDRERLTREIRIMKMLNSPNVIRLYEVIDTTKHIFLILENAPGGELFDYIVAHERIKEKEARKFFRQLISGVDYFHQRSVIHRDLKPENLLLDSDMNIKIVDFGFSNQVTPGNLLHTFCGSPAYAAPEMISGKEYVGPEVDMWSLGVILFAMLCGYLPFDNSNVSRLYQQVLKGEYHAPEFLSAESRQLISRLLVLNPEKRATMDEVKNHVWVNIGYSGAPEVYSVGNDVIDMAIVKELETIGFDPNYATKSLKEAERNQVTATYWLLFDKKRKEVQKLQNQGLSVVEQYDHIESNQRPLSPMAENPSSPSRKSKGLLDPNSVSEPSKPIERLPLIREKRGSIMKNSLSALPDESSPPQGAPLHIRAALQAKGAGIQEPTRERSNSFRRRRHSAALPFLDTEDSSSKSLVPNANISPNSPETKLSSLPISIPNPIYAQVSVELTASPGSVEAPNSLLNKRLSQETVPITANQPGSNGRLACMSELKEVRGVFSISTTSSKPVRVIVEELKRVLNGNSVSFRESGYLLECDDKQGIRFEIEVCKPHNLNTIVGLRLKRVSGDTWLYKKLCQKIASECQL